MKNPLKAVIKRLHYPLEVMLQAVRWYLAYNLSYRNLEEMLQERGVRVDHSNVQRWVIKLTPVLEDAFRKRKNKKSSGSGSICDSWRLDETYIKIKGEDHYLYRAVDKYGKTIDFLLTAKRDRAAAQSFLAKAIKSHGVPRVITIDKSGANTAAIMAYNGEHETHIEIRQCKYLNNMVEQDHRRIKRRIRPMLGFQTFSTASIVLGGIELIHMLRKGQLEDHARFGSLAHQFDSLVTA
jgi:putative transposase